MADDRSKGLILKFAADTLPAQRSIQTFAQVAGANMLALGQSANRSSDALQDLSNRATSLQSVAEKFPIIGGLASRGLGLIAALAQEAGKEIAGLIKIADDAAGSGVGTTFFQAYINKARELGVEAHTLAAELAKAKESGKVGIGKEGDDDAGKSDALKQLQLHVKSGNLGQSAIGAFSSSTGEDHIRVMLDLLQQLDDKGAKLAEYDLAKSFFGDSFEERLRAGQDAIGAMRTSLDAIKTSGGARIIPADQIAHAKEIKAEIDALNERLANVTAPAAQKVDNIFLNIDEVLVAGEAAIVGYVEKLASFIDKWLGAGNAVAWVNTKVLELANQLRSMAGIDPIKIGTGGTMDPDDPTGSKALAAQERLRIQMLNSGGGNPYGGLNTAKGPNPFGDLSGAQSAMAGAKKPDTSNDLPKDEKKEKASADTKDAIEQYIDNLTKETVAEEANAATLGMNNKQKREAVDLAKAQAIAKEDDRTLTAQETADIKAQSDAFAAAETKINQFNKAQEDAKARAEFLGQSFESAVEKMAIGGGRLKDVLLDVIKSLEQAALKALILGQGPLAGLLGTGSGGLNGEGKGFGGLGGLLGFATSGFGGGGTAANNFAGQAAGAQGPFSPAAAGAGLGIFGSIGKLFSGFFADGGVNPAGGWGIVGEAGPEIINGPGTITPMGAINKAMGSMGGGGGSSVINHAPTYNIAPAGGVSIAQMEAAFEKNNKAFARNILPTIANARRRYTDPG